MISVCLRPNKLRGITWGLCLTLVALALLLSGGGCRKPTAPDPQVPTHSLLPSPSSTRDAHTLLLAADAWPPYNCDPSTGQEGYVVDLARSIFEPRGWKVDYQLLAWERALEQVREGAIDGAIGASPSDGMGLQLPQQEIAQNFPVFFVRTGHPWKYENPGSLEHICLGAISGYDYRPVINEWISANQHDPHRIQLVSGNTALDQNVRKLLAGRIDAIIDNETSVRWALRQVGVSNQVQLAGSVPMVVHLYIAFSPSPRGVELSHLWDQGLGELRANGKLSAILSRYGLSDWRPTEEKLHETSF